MNSKLEQGCNWYIWYNFEARAHRNLSLMSFSMPIHPVSEPSTRRASLELSRFSTLFQQWDLASGETSPRRASYLDDLGLLSGSQTSASNTDLDVLGPPHTRQRTTLACDKCRDRKIKCSGDHPICKRCTARGLICHYSERERVRGPTKARLRNAMSSSSLDLHFEADSQGPAIRQEDSDLVQSQQSQFHHLSFPPQARFPFSQPCSQAASPTLDPPESSMMSLPQTIHRRVQSHSFLGAVYRHHLPFGYRPTGGAMFHLGRSSVVEFDMRMTNGGHYQDPGMSSSSEPRSLSASRSAFGPELVSRSSKSSDSTFPEPLSRSASEVDLRLNHMSQYRHLRLCNSEDAGKTPCHEHGFHSPEASMNSFSGLSLGRSGPDIAVPPINEIFRNPWVDEKLVITRDVKLVYPSPITPIALSRDAIDKMARGGSASSYYIS
ncbi:hypothetical protein B0H12DRAFT_217393 [Mycena haematopus]|nr:hypothetical protein B0H12DRAFT_217393 [Mycena haematopus]